MELKIRKLMLHGVSYLEINRYIFIHKYSFLTYKQTNKYNIAEHKNHYSQISKYYSLY